MVEHSIRNRAVVGSNPTIGFQDVLYVRTLNVAIRKLMSFLAIFVILTLVSQINVANLIFLAFRKLMSLVTNRVLLSVLLKS